GRYHGSMNEAETIGIELNVLIEKPAPIPPEFADTPFLFLANTHPAVQAQFARQMSRARLIVCDTMNLWIAGELDNLKTTLKLVHGLVLNESKARMLTNKANLVTAGRQILELDPAFIVIKKDENGSILVSRDDLFVLPAYPTEKTIDPTGCGDTFAGAM